jgi:hypothetical protein
VHYKIPLHTTHYIIKSCPVYAPLHRKSHPSSATPQGLCTNELWQMDVTHITYLHVAIDTYSKFIWAIPQCNENVCAVIASLLQCFAVMGVSSKFETDNGPASTVH